MKVMEAFKRGFSVAAGALNLLLVLFVYYAAAGFLRMALMPKTKPQDWGASEWSVALPLGIILLLFGIFIQAGILGFVRDAIKSGKASLGKFLEYGRQFFLNLLGLWLSVTLILIGLFSVALIATSLIAALTAKSAASYVISGLLFSIGGGLVIYLALLLFYSPYVLVADGVKVFQALKKSISFVRGRLGRIIGLAVIAVLFALGVGLLLGFLLGIIKVLGAPALLSKILNTLFVSAINTYLNVVITAAFMALYLGLSAPQTEWKPGPADTSAAPPEAGTSA